jgi:hypothetical protein
VLAVLREYLVCEKERQAEREKEDAERKSAEEMKSLRADKEKAENALNQFRSLLDSFRR